MSMKKPNPKCPKCKGTGTVKPPYLGKCTECNGTGVKQHFEMMFWAYSAFPGVLASRGFMCDNGTCYCPAYDAHFRPIKVLPLKDGIRIARQLDQIKKDYTLLLETLRLSFQARAGEIASWLKNK